MKSTRDGFGDQLVAEAKHNQDILVLTADLGKPTKVDQFKELYPDRFFDVGIAENNMIGIASGLSEYGYKVFLTSFGSFLTGKYDTIRCSIALPKAPVILVGSHVGMAIGKDGATQMALEDVALMRALPGIIILNPSTYIEARKIMEWLCNTKLDNPCYLRIGRQPVREIFDDTYEFLPNRDAVLIKHGSSGVVFSTGCILGDVLDAVKDIDVSLYHIPILKPMYKDLIFRVANKYNHIFTVEDHSIIGGLGSIIAEIMAENPSGCKLTRIGLEDVFPGGGSPDDLYEKYGLSVSKIRDRIVRVLNEST